MWHICRLNDAIQIQAGERSRVIRPAERVDLGSEFSPGVPLAAVVRPEWFEPEEQPLDAEPSKRKARTTTTEDAA